MSLNYCILSYLSRYLERYISRIKERKANKNLKIHCFTPPLLTHSWFPRELDDIFRMVEALRDILQLFEMINPR